MNDELRVNLSTVAQANAVLLERDDATLAEIEDTLLFLAHQGTKESVEILEKYQSKAHIRVAGFAECALDEGKYMSIVPRSEAERQRMLKEEVLKRYEEYLCAAQSEIDETVKHEIDLIEYELEVARRVIEKQTRRTEGVDWKMEINFLEVDLGMKRGRLEELQAEIVKYEALMAEVEADLETGD